MITILLYVIVAALPVIAFRFNLRLKHPLNSALVALICAIACGVLLWAAVGVFHSEFHAAWTAMYDREPVSANREFDSAARASRAISSNASVFGTFLILWNVFVIAIELAKGDRTAKHDVLSFVLCTTCDHEEPVNPALAGLEGNCPKCGAVLTFPAGCSQALSPCRWWGSHRSWTC